MPGPNNKENEKTWSDFFFGPLKSWWKTAGKDINWFRTDAPPGHTSHKIIAPIVDTYLKNTSGFIDGKKPIHRGGWIINPFKLIFTGLTAMQLGINLGIDGIASRNREKGLKDTSSNAKGLASNPVARVFKLILGFPIALAATVVHWFAAPEDMPPIANRGKEESSNPVVSRAEEKARTEEREKRINALFEQPKPDVTQVNSMEMTSVVTAPSTPATKVEDVKPEIVQPIVQKTEEVTIKTNSQSTIRQRLSGIKDGKTEVSYSLEEQEKKLNSAINKNENKKMLKALKDADKKFKKEHESSDQNAKAPTSKLTFEDFKYKLEKRIGENSMMWEKINHEKKKYDKRQNRKVSHSLKLKAS